MGPSQEAKEVGQARKEVAERYAIRNRWWSSLIERSAGTTRLHAHITPGDYSWIGVSSGFRGLNLNYTVTQDSRAAELYIDRESGPAVSAEFLPTAAIGRMTASGRDYRKRRSTPWSGSIGRCAPLSPASGVNAERRCGAEVPSEFYTMASA